MIPSGFFKIKIHADRATVYPNTISILLLEGKGNTLYANGIRTWPVYRIVYFSKAFSAVTLKNQSGIPCTV